MEDFLFHLLVFTAVLLLMITLLSREFQTKEQDASLMVKRTRSIVDFTFAGRVGLHTRLQMRAIPNHRLVQAFGVTNSFTTVCPDIHSEFIIAASVIVTVDNAAWQVLFDSAIHILKHEVSECVHYRHSRLEIAPCVRHLCIRIVLSILFAVDPLKPARDDIAIITEEINKQWLQSKSHAKVTRSPSLSCAITNLHLSLPDSESSLSPEQALALILPAYETLWRVVLLTFVSIFHRSPKQNAGKGLEDVPRCLGVRGIEKEALQVAKEALRLYPSTKRVYRSHPVLSSGQNVSADVEWCHRDPKVWGPDSLLFRPGRFNHLSSLQADAYLPFGLRPHRCPAFGGFGERLVAMLVTVLGRELPDSTTRLHFDDEDMDNAPDVPLPTGREDMERWVLSILCR